MEAYSKDRLLEAFAEGTRRVLGDRLTGIYLHGSAAMGCYNPAKSDLDLIVVVENALTDADRRAYMTLIDALNAQTPGKGIEMSVVRRNVCNPFVYPTPFELHFSNGHLAWYREQPEDYIRRMRGTDKDLAAHFTVIRHRGLCLYGRPIPGVFGEVPEANYMDALWYDIGNAREEIAEHPLYTILNLARVLAWNTEGAVLSKLEGGSWGLRNLPPEFHPLLQTALNEYQSAASPSYDPDLLPCYAEYMLSRIGQNKK